jgi:AraC-like DNA-binding protein
LERFIWSKQEMQLHSWLTEVRQRHAALLACEDRTMKEIAFELGYGNPAQFARDFKKFHGLTPTAYRAAALRRKMSRSDQECRALISVLPSIARDH